jgi:hypothetical protein
MAKQVHMGRIQLRRNVACALSALLVCAGGDVPRRTIWQLSPAGAKDSTRGGTDDWRGRTQRHEQM